MQKKKTGKSNGAVAIAAPKKKPKTGKSPARTKRKEPLTNARLLELAAKRKPPQSWYDEDFDGI